MTHQQPAMLLYDGQCGICQEWVRYWRQLTGDRIEYRPYQQVAHQYPNLSPQALANAIHLIEADGAISTGAEATYRLCRHSPPQAILLVLYRFLPGFARLSEFGYRFFSTHRRLLAWLTHLFWGRNPDPPRYHCITWLFLRGLGLVYLIAFLSFTVQALALIGSDGILPLQYTLSALRDQHGATAWLKLPTVFWWSHADACITGVGIAGIGLALCLVAGVCTRISLILLYLLYLSIVNAGQVFMAFQWDSLLLECGFLAIFLPWGASIIVWLYRWLVFRFLLSSGLVKIISADSTWQRWTALNYHFETQPLPTPLAWYAHHLPEAVLKAATGATLIIELIIPFFIFAPRNIRHIAAWCFLLFQTIILLTGNYNFFNLLTLLLCLFLFDDAALRRITPRRLLPHAAHIRLPTPGSWATGCAVLLAALSVSISGVQTADLLRQPVAGSHSAAYRLLMPFRLVNPYGPFAIITTERNEIVIEGSADGIHWQPYRFRYKPDDPAQCPGWVAPHQPRVDWQMWFAVLSPPDTQRWLWNLLIRLLQNSESVTGLLADNPFSNQPPRNVRAVVYRYTFTSVEERNKTGRCWNRQRLATYYPPIRISNGHDAIY